MDRHEKPHHGNAHNPEALELTVDGISVRVWGRPGDKGRNTFVIDLAEVSGWVSEWDWDRFREELRAALTELTGKQVTVVPADRIDWQER